MAQRRESGVVYTRGDGGAWVLREYDQGTELRLSGPDIAISVDALYRLALEADDGA